jgi:phage shock protein C
MNKRIYKIRAQKKICGVCAGVAEYFEIDPTLVRVVWAALALAGSVGFWAYIICAIVFPDKTEVA